VTGILGGTFDPPHYGHLVLAEEARALFGLDRVLLVPSRRPPHKSSSVVAPFQDRLSMLRLAAEDNPFLEVADIESEDGPSYTIDLLRRAISLGIEPVFITGTDEIPEMASWKDFPHFLDLARFVAGTRAGAEDVVFPPEALGRVEVFEMPGMMISSSSIRARFARSGPVRYLIPESVRSFVSRKGLYGFREGH